MKDVCRVLEMHTKKVSERTLETLCSKSPFAWEWDKRWYAIEADALLINIEYPLADFLVNG